MDRRRQPRLAVDQPVQITTLTRPSQTFSGRALDLSGSGMRVALPTAIPVNTLVRIEAPDLLLLGEVCWTRQVDGGCELGLKLQHALTGLGELERLNRGLWQEFAPLPLKAK